MLVSCVRTIEEEVYTITFESNGGTQVEPLEISEGTLFNELDITDPTYEGYTFEGWYLDEALESEVAGDYEIVSDITLYASWEIIPGNVTISFYLYDDVYEEPMVIQEGSTIDPSSLPNPVRTHFIFDGWYLRDNYVAEVSDTFVFNEDWVLYAKWIDDPHAVIATDDPVVLGLTGAQYGGDINFPTQQNLGSSTIIRNESVETLDSGATTMSYRTLGMTTKPLTLESDPLYVYFNWDGSFAVMEDYTMTVDTSRTEQEVLSYNLNDFADLADYEVFVNYVRYKITAGGEEYVYYEGDAMMDSGNSTAIVLNNQTVEYDEVTQSFNIAIQRQDIDETLATYLSSHSDATLEVIGIQIFVIHRAKTVEYWDDGETIVGSNSKYIYYDETTDLSVASYHPGLSVDVEGVPQETLYDWVQTGAEPDVNYNYLAMFKVFYALEENVFPENPDTIYLTQHNIEYGETKEPNIGVQYDQNPNADEHTLYFSVPVQANTVSMYEDEREYFESPDTMYRGMEFLIWVGHKYDENGEYKFNSNKTGTMTLNERSNLIINEVPDVNGNMISVNIGDKVDLIGLYSIRYNEPVINLLNNQVVNYPGTTEPIIANMDFTMDWIYQGNIPIDLGTSTVDDVFVVEQSMYIYKNYKFDINDVMFGRLEESAEVRRALLEGYLYRFYLEADTYEIIADYTGDLTNLLPFTIRISNNTIYANNNTYNDAFNQYKNWYPYVLIMDDYSIGIYWQNIEDWSTIIFWYRGYYYRDIIEYSKTHVKDMESLEYWLGIS
jgi:uncharacterized repeat protein (TIGR02543 family)